MILPEALIQKDRFISLLDQGFGRYESSQLFESPPQAGIQHN